MTSKVAIQRIKDGLNKEATDTNANLTEYNMEDALNKALNDWIRRQVHGGNIYKEGSEESQMRVDDLQHLLIPERKISVTNGPTYADISKLPPNYRYYNRLTAVVKKGECKGVRMSSSFIENANVDDYLGDWASSPSFEFEQAFHVMHNNKFRVFHNGEFEVEEVLLSYYKHPKKISCEKTAFDIEWEWKDDVAEVIIDEAIKILAGNIQDANSYQIASKREQENN